jgi:hypothetical protein
LQKSRDDGWKIAQHFSAGTCSFKKQSPVRDDRSVSFVPVGLNPFDSNEVPALKRWAIISTLDESRRGEASLPVGMVQNFFCKLT